jgi:hypothetical protein
MWGFNEKRARSSSVRGITAPGRQSQLVTLRSAAYNASEQGWCPVPAIGTFHCHGDIGSIKEGKGEYLLL